MNRETMRQCMQRVIEKTEGMPVSYGPGGCEEFLDRKIEHALEWLFRFWKENEGRDSKKNVAHDTEID